MANTTGQMYAINLTESVSIWLMTFALAQAVLGSIFNMVVIVAFLCLRELRKRHSDYFVCNLAVADLVFLCTFEPWLAFNVFKGCISNGSYHYYESWQGAVQLYCTQAILIIAVDRFVAVVYPFKYKTIVTRTNVYAGSSLTLALAVFFGLLNFAAYKLVNFYRTFLYIWIIYQALLLVIMSVIYYVIFRATKKHGESIKKQAVIMNQLTRRNDMASFSSLLKLTTNTFILACLFGITFLPTITYITYASLIERWPNQDQTEVRCWIYCLSAVNSCLNPIIYVFRTRRFKVACCMKKRRDVSVKSYQLSLRIGTNRI